ncbi:thioesterase [Halobacteriales archaeon QS_4_69_34]|nr:MAG: thioesterase [Halobacteriales archaeon QS_4_69_34]
MSSPTEFINDMPATKTFGMEVTGTNDGRATARLPLQEKLCFDSGDSSVLHGAAIFALADNAGAAAVMSHFEEPQPAYTIDLRIDYLDAARTALTAEAEVLRYGSVVGVADIIVEDADDNAVSAARGTYRSAR